MYIIYIYVCVSCLIVWIFQTGFMQSTYLRDIPMYRWHFKGFVQYPNFHWFSWYGTSWFQKMQVWCTRLYPISRQSLLWTLVGAGWWSEHPYVVLLASPFNPHVFRWLDSCVTPCVLFFFATSKWCSKGASLVLQLNSQFLDVSIKSRFFK